MANVSNVAKYFLMLASSGEEDAGETMTHLKLQKLLYYAQGFHVALNGGKTLFPDTIEAWRQGPVVNSVWGTYKGSKSNPIAPDASFDPAALSEPERELLNDVWNAYGQFSAWKLRDMTHAEPPWLQTYERDKNNPIPVALLNEYFSTQIQQ